MKETSKAFFLRPLSITILSLVLTATAFITGISFLELMELKTVDLRFVSRGPIPASGDAVMAIIDEKSLEAEGRWPWPRSKMARLVDVLSQSGARVIGFDIGFLDPDENVALKVSTPFQKKQTTWTSMMKGS
ncbi:MAG: CHASE2 domain-containing protein [Deltaproteobacteria bacterium]|nr:CHASE2 domain-containing protein [Deltaproteobacteria bacterium]